MELGDSYYIMLYNGLQSEMNLLSKFVFIYETEIKYKRKADDFLMISAQATYVFKHNIQPKVRYATKDKIAIHTDFSKFTLIFTKDKVQIIDFCRHLRNSFVHALLERRGQTLLITDKSRNRETCKGTLEYNLVRNFILQVVKDYEL